MCLQVADGGMVHGGGVAQYCPDEQAEQVAQAVAAACGMGFLQGAVFADGLDGDASS
jgi:hypothetical protein